VQTGQRGALDSPVSAPMSSEPWQDIAKTSADQWRFVSEDATAIKECAVIKHFPEELPVNRYREPLRYTGIRGRFLIFTTPSKLVRWNRFTNRCRPSARYPLRHKVSPDRTRRARQVGSSVSTNVFSEPFAV
jgi:hypothetical protein